MTIASTLFTIGIIAGIGIFVGYVAYLVLLGSSFR